MKFIIHCNHDNIAMKTNSSGSVLPILTYLCFSMSIAALIGLLVYNRKYQLNLNIPGSNLENLSITLFTCKCIVYVRHRSIHYMESVLHYRSCSSLPLPVCILVHDYICDLHHGETLTDEVTRYTTRRGYCTQKTSHHCHGASDYILSIVDKGYGIPFKQVPKKAFLNNNKSSREHVDFVETEIRVVFQRLKKYLQQLIL